MYKIRKITENHVIDFAAEELKKYLRMMMPRCGEVEICGAEGGSDGYRLGLMQEFGLSVSEAKNVRFDDIVHIDTDDFGGIIAGSNPRSVLLAVYEFLRQNGCRWLFPGVDGELIPMQQVHGVKYHKMADMRWRGQCNEGAEFQQSMLAMIDFTPKVGLNSFMQEFDIPYGYYSFYYDHLANKSREPEPVTRENILQWKRMCEAEISKRGLLCHDIGHGWSVEAFGIESHGAWRSTDAYVPEESRKYLAEIGGKRELFGGVPINTNFCMSNPEARRIVNRAIVKYAEENRGVDVLHVWLADGSRNHCECENCRKMRPSDWYVVMLNELDEMLTEKGLDTIIGGIAYSDTAWEPEKETIKNPDRFLFNLAAISRSYTYSVGKDPIVPETPYERNVSLRLATMEEYMMRGHRWMKMAKSEFFAYEYHFWIHQFYAPGAFTFARRVYEDVLSYKANRIEGMIEDGSQRSFFPNGLAFFVYGRTLFDNSVKFEDLVDEYMTAAYGDAKEKVAEFFREIEGAMHQKFIETPHSRGVTAEHYHNAEELEHLKRVAGICAESEAALAPYRNSKYRVQTVAVRLLDHYRALCCGLADLLMMKARGEDNAARDAFKAFLKEYGKREQSIELYYDQRNLFKAFNPIFKLGADNEI